MSEVLDSLDVNFSACSSEAAWARFATETGLADGKRVYSLPMDRSDIYYLCCSSRVLMPKERQFSIRWELMPTSSPPAGIMQSSLRAGPPADFLNHLIAKWPAEMEVHAQWAAVFVIESAAPLSRDLIQGWSRVSVPGHHLDPCAQAWRVVPADRVERLTVHVLDDGRAALSASGAQRMPLQRAIQLDLAADLWAEIARVALVADDAASEHA